MIIHPIKKLYFLLISHYPHSIVDLIVLWLLLFFPYPHHMIYTFIYTLLYIAIVSAFGIHIH